MKYILPLIVAGVIALAFVSPQASGQQPVASCSGSLSSCSGSLAASARVTVFRRAPVRTWLQNRPKRVRGLFKALAAPKASCSSSLSCGG